MNEGLNKNENKSIKSDEEILLIYGKEHQELDDKILPFDKIVFDEPDERDINSHNEWEKKMDERSLLNIKIDDLDYKILFVKKYNLKLNEFIDKFDEFISLAQNDIHEEGPLSIVDRIGELHELNLFLEVCNQKNLEDFEMLKIKKDQFFSLMKTKIEEREKENKRFYKIISGEKRKV